MSSDLLARIAAKRQEYTGAPDTTPTAALPGAPSQEEKVVSASGRPAETDADSSSSSSMIDSMIEAKLEYARALGTTPALADPISERKKVIVVHDPAPTTVDSALLRNAASTMPASNPGSVLARIEAKRLEYLHAPDTTPKPAAGVQVVKEIVMGRAPEPEPDLESAQGTRPLSEAFYLQLERDRSEREERAAERAAAERAAERAERISAATAEREARWAMALLLSATVVIVALALNK